jgi:multimeric flavodoxin WrbA
MVSRIFAVHTSTHDPSLSSSAALTRAALSAFAELYPNAEIRWLDAAKIRIAPNLSCYANGKTHCGDPKSGKYRCWANFNSTMDPRKHGIDEMPAIYDGLEWCDTFLFSTSNRWGTHSAVAQNIIERMNTLENRGASLGEPYPLHGKRLGVIVSGLHWKTANVAKNLVETLKWWGFATAGDDSILAWQRSPDPFFEHPDNDEPYTEKWLKTERGRFAVSRFVNAVSHANKIAV